MRMRSFLGAAAMVPLALSLVAMAPPGADPESCRDTGDAEDPVVLCTIGTYFQCPADDADKVLLPNDGVTIATDAPTRSYQDGAGCGQLDEPVFGSTAMAANLYEFYASGSFSGNVDSATVEVHLLGPGIGQLGEEIEFETRLRIDGRSVFGDETVTSVTGEQSTLPRRVRLTPEVIPSSTNASVALRFTVTGIAEFLDDLELKEPGHGGAHFIDLTFNYPHTGDCQSLPPNGSERCVPAGVYPYVWGAEEIPSGVTFNVADESLHGLVVPAGDPS